MTEDYDKVMAGERVRAFLADEFVQRAFVKVRDGAVQLFKLAKDDTELRRAQAIVRVVDTFEGMLAQVVEEGEMARNAE